MFLPLTKDNVREIAKIQLKNLTAKLHKQGINLIIKEEALNWIAETGYDPFFGARPIKRVIQKNVMNELSKSILSDSIDTSKNVILDIFDDQIVFRKPINEDEEVVIAV
jgi:ATP-dependent Clp protease ATP-binding subunit ClpB